MLHLYDTATASRAPLNGAADKRVGLYVCGPTVYGPPHIGHGRFTLVYDILRRYLESTGVVVDHVSNVTDIDDKIIDVAKRHGRTQADVAAEFEADWWSAMDGLGVLKPTTVTHATAYVSDMVSLVSELMSRGVAYETSDGVYLEVRQVEGYGLLAQQPLDSLRAGARVDVNEEKRSPFDFALWKKAKPGEPQWEAPFGAGRPGWHTECVVMALDVLGEGFSLHGGGEDLKFPHHENERAQAVVLERPFAQHWMHNGMLVFGGEKMSKSLGNVTDLKGLLAENDPRSYRLSVLQAHYRAQMELRPETIEASNRALRGLDALARRLGEAGRAGGQLTGQPGEGRQVSSGSVAPHPGGESQTKAGEIVTSFRRHMDDDLSTPEAIAVAFDGLRAANSAFDAGDTQLALAVGEAVLDCFAAVGLLPGTDREVSSEALDLARHRDLARANRDYAAADRLRDEIVALGYRVEDMPSGTRVIG
ncbi:MAG: cysteine--tRNA ligase [Acidimicrobiales bacterium]